MAKRFANPSLFRQLNQPFADVDAANAAIEAFFEELGSLREKHKMANVLLVVEGSYLVDGEEQEFITSASYGDGAKPLAMAAWAHGREEATYADAIATIRSQGRKR